MFSGNKKVGVIGLGIIGSRVAAQLREAEWNTYVWNRTPKPAPNALGSPAEVAEVARVLQLFVRDSESLLEVVNALEPALTAKHVIINHATVSPEATKEAAAIVDNAGAAFLDAPFTGSRDAAAGGALNYYIGGDEKVLEKVRPLLEVSSNTITHFGDIGSATVLKIATNMITATSVAVLAEAMTIAEKGGVDLSKMQDALAVNACCSGVMNMKLPSMLEENYEPHFSLKNMFKDAQFGLAMADAEGIQLPVLSSAASALLEQMRAGRDEDDFSVVYENYK